MKKCSICGITEKDTKIIKGLCRKHYLQMYRHGKISRTIYDKNEIITHDDYSEIVLYDKNGNENGRSKIDTELE